MLAPLDASPVPAPTLHLLDWSAPLLPAAARYLAADWSGRGPLDLGDVLVVVPTRRAGRRLREALAALAAERGQAVFAPRVIQPVGLLDEAAGSASVATPAEMRVGWIEVLRAARLADLDAVFPIEPPDQGFAWASRLARQLLDVQSELGKNGLRFADVPDRAGAFPDLRRWRQLADLERRHDARLASAGRVSRHAARIAAASRATPPAGVARIVVIGTTDPMALALQRLEAMAEGVPVEIVAHGPSPDAFDRWGRPVVDTWIRRWLDLPDFDRQVHLHADPSAQADAIGALVAAHRAARRDPAGHLGIAIADREIHAPLRHALERVGIPAYDPAGMPYRATELHRLLELLLALVEEPAFSTAASLLRCPAVLDWIGHETKGAVAPATLLEAVDALRARHLPPTLAEARRHALAHRPRAGEAPWGPVATALDALARLRDLASGSFPSGVQTALAALHAHRRFATADPDDAAAIAAARAWADIARSTADATERLGRLQALDTWRLALQEFGESHRFEERPPDALELQGWLELPWEDAPHLLVAGLNEEHVPAAVVGHAFLPEALRERLGLRTNDMRLARDAHLLHTLVASRARHGRIDLLLGRASASGDPLRPSRLLLLCPDEALAGRVARLFRDIPPAPGSASATAWRRAWRLEPPAPAGVERVSVTAFRDHLACPFRFFLRHQLRMREIDPAKEELDALDFGTLVHDALEGLHAEPEMRRCTDPDRVRDLLIDRLDRRALALYGPQVTVPLLVQLESARQRLTQAARIHAADAAAGWVLHAVEHPFTCAVGPLTVSGRIDRIDRHEPTGAVRVLDYKTFDTAKDPADTHTRRAPHAGASAPPPPEYACFTAPDGRELAWLDLQLPLYRRALAAEFGAAIAVGYFNLPKAASATGVHLWEGFDAAWQTAADRCAEGVAAAIAAGVFWPPAERTAFTDEFATLFHEGAEASVAWTANPGIER